MQWKILNVKGFADRIAELLQLDVLVVSERNHFVIVQNRLLNVVHSVDDFLLRIE